jgi:hypothetical protein
MHRDARSESKDQLLYISNEQNRVELVVVKLTLQRSI